MLSLYIAIMRQSGPLLRLLLDRRLRRGREDAARLPERMGRPSRSRPPGRLVWVHAASVGEAQSTLRLIDLLLAREPGLNILVTSGTVTSAALLGDRLPRGAFHQFYPLDHPAWVDAFLKHWRPDLALWMESELWPAMLTGLARRRVPVVLLNARLSERSTRRWMRMPGAARRLLSTFTLILAQTEDHAARYRALGAARVEVMANLKYGAAPLPCDEDMLAELRRTLGVRPCWVFASTHAGEEALACRVQAALKSDFPNLLTVIVPRHPARGPAIAAECAATGLAVRRRALGQAPDNATNLYVADTLGELGLFYRLCPVACIGRSFSDDGGGGHNPAEAALLGCAVIHGPHVQNLQEIYDEMDRDGAAIPAQDEAALVGILSKLLSDPGELAAARDKAAAFAEARTHAAEAVVEKILPLLDRADDRRLA